MDRIPTVVSVFPHRHQKHTTMPSKPEEVKDDSEEVTCKSKRQRKKKPLPDEISRMTAKDLHWIVVKCQQVSKDIAGYDIKQGQDALIAVSVELSDENTNETTTYDIKRNLTLDQLCHFSKNLGVPNASKMSKIACLVAIAFAKDQFCVIKSCAIVEVQKEECNQKWYNTLV